MNTFIVFLLLLQAKVEIHSPIQAIAADQRAGILAVGLTERVVLLDSSSGLVVGKSLISEGTISSIAWENQSGLLAVAIGKPGNSGKVQFFGTIKSNKLLNDQGIIQGPADLIMGLTFSPDGKLLAGASYDRKVYLWDVAKKIPHAILTDHSDWVRSVSFSPNGALLATCGGDRSVKIWEVASGLLKYSLNDSTGETHSVTWSGDGKSVFFGGTDKSLRKQFISSTDASPAESLFGHGKTITSMIRNNDPETIITLGDDRLIKIFLMNPLKFVFTSQIIPSPVTCFALVGLGKIAVGCRDETIYIINTSNGKISSSIFADSEESIPVVKSVEPQVFITGNKGKLQLTGTALALLRGIRSPFPGLNVNLEPMDSKQTRLISYEAGPGLIPGPVEIELLTANTGPLKIRLQITLSDPSNEEKGRKAGLKNMETIHGKLDNAGEADLFPISIGSGLSIGLIAHSGSTNRWIPEIELVDNSGNTIRRGKNQLALPTNIFPFKGWVQIRDREFIGGFDRTYFLSLGPIPLVENCTPLKVAPGTKAVIRLNGLNLPISEAVLQIPPDAVVGSVIPLPPQVATLPGAPAGILVSKTQVTQPNHPIRSFPSLLQSKLTKTVKEESWTFEGKKGTPLWIETFGQRIGSSIDTVLRITNSHGGNLIRVRLIPSSQSMIAFRDHDAGTTGIRLESWKSLRVNDYLYGGGDLMRIKTLPRNPDDDCQFHAFQGKRLGWHGTTPAQHPIGQTLFKVDPVKSDLDLPVGPFPVIDLSYVTDDGGGDAGCDSSIVFMPPYDGIFQAWVGDSSGRVQSDLPYGLSISNHSPDFSVKPLSGMVEHTATGCGEVTIEVARHQDQSGPLHVQIINLPPGWSSVGGRIAEGEYSATILLQPNAMAGELGSNWRCLVRNSDSTGEKSVSGIPGKIIQPSSVAVVADVKIIQCTAGEVVRLPIRIQRSGNFNGRVPVEVRGLPAGVRIQDGGLNGILVPPGQDSRILQIEVDSWVETGLVGMSLVAKEKVRPQVAQSFWQLKTYPDTLQEGEVRFFAGPKA